MTDLTAPDFLSGGGEMGALIRAKDWSATPLGPTHGWPQSLRTSVSTCLNCAFPILVWWGPDLVKLYNDAYALILGAKHPAALGAPGREVWPEIWDVIGPMLHRVLGDGLATRAEDLLLPLRRHGYAEECYFSFSYSPIRDESGGVGGVFCPVIETTERVIGERRQRLLRQLAERTPDLRDAEAACAAAAVCVAEEAARDLPFAAFYLVDAAGASARLAAAAGLAAGDPACPADMPLAPGAAWPFTSADRPLTVAIAPTLRGRLLRGPWDGVPTHALVAPLGGGVRPVGFMVASLNPHRPVAEVAGLAELVAQQVATAIGRAQAHEAERRRAETLAELDRAKTAFFSNISHEFRTPLTLTLGTLEEALDDAAAAPPGSRQRARLEVAHRNALRLLRLVNTLLDFSRIEAGRVQASYRPTDLAALTADLASGFRSAIERAGLTLAIDCPALPAPVFVDRDMWEKIILNLLSNAFKFTFAGGVSVTLRADGGCAMLTVRDSGVGIPADELPRIFDRFHRIQGQRSRSFEGSGIGLALVHELVRLHGGRIAAASTPGEGSRFTVAIPFGTAHLDAARIGGAAPIGATALRAEAFVEEALHWLPDLAAGGIGAADAAVPATANGTRAAVLVADDNADMRDYVRRLLAPHYDVLSAADGEAALAAIRRHHPDLVLADVMMPVADGFALLRAIRADAALRDLPVLLLSARAGEEARTEGLDAGADDYLTKPFAARELLARVRANVDLARLRREATAALRRLNESLESEIAERTAERDRLWDLSEDLLAIGDYQGGLLRVSPSWQRVLGYDLAALRGLHWRGFVHPEDFPEVAAQLAAIATSGGPARVEARLRAADGSWRWIAWHIAPDPGGSFAYGVGRDITAERQRAAALRDAEEALRQAQKMEAIGQLTGGLAHDFNNLLTGIAGSLELLQVRAAQGRIGELDRHVAGAMASVNRAAALTHRLLAFARRQALDPRPTDVNALVAGMTELIRRTVGPAVRVETVCAAGLWPTLIDPNQLESALLNLCINARDAMPEGGRLTIETVNAALDEAYVATERDLRAGQYVALAVTDTGSGMTPDVMARAFEPFFTTKPIGQGTGLGLSMLYGFAKQSDGHVRIYSEVGRGTTVRVYLPRHGDAAVMSAAATVPAPGAQPVGNGRRVLVVEDEALVRALVVEVLAELGFAALEAQDGPAGLRILQSSERIDLLISDVGLPGLNGRQLADAARERRPSLKVLFITGYAHNAAIGNGLLEPGMEMIAKPFALAALAAKIRAMTETDRRDRVPP